MSKLIMCQGLPGSGKSTWAKAYVTEHPDESWIIVNKDDIRDELSKQGWVWSRDGEKQQVIPARDAMIEGALKNGANVISSDTNFGGGHEQRLKQLADEFGADFQIRVFNTPFVECVRRDLQRGPGKRVGEQVIRSMAEKYMPHLVGKKHAIVEWEPGLPNALICDLDGTIAIHVDRNPYDCEKCGSDKVNPPILTIINTYYNHLHYKILYVSGRDEKCRAASEKWLIDNNCPPGLLLMRPGGDIRKDVVIKGELFEQYIRGQFNVDFVLDDRDQVVKFWREIGLTCLQVAEGNF